MNKCSKFIFSILLLSTFEFYCQGEGVLQFTTLQQSPLLLGAGQIGVSFPNDDVLGYYFNPAILGYSARNNHSSISFMPDKTIWAGYNYGKTTFHTYGLNLGYNLKSSKLNLPISIGLGYLHNKFDYGNRSLTSEFSPEIIGEVENYDQFDSFSLGIGIDYYLKLNLGVSLKLYESHIGGIVTNDQIKEYSTDGTMFDYGALLILPISELFFDDLKYQFDNSAGLKPLVNFSIGYSTSNIGDEVYYVDEAQKDPLYRTARLGYTFEIGFDLQLNKAKINFINYSFTAEAQDVLIEPRTEFSNNTVYQSGIGDINVSDNLIKLKGDENVIVHRGHIFKFFDTLILTSGRFAGHGYNSTRRTDGIGFTSKGIFNLLNTLTDNRTLNYLTNHFVLEYFDSNVEFFEYLPINFDGLSIHFVGFEI